MPFIRGGRPWQSIPPLQERGVDGECLRKKTGLNCLIGLSQNRLLALIVRKYRQITTTTLTNQVTSVAMLVPDLRPQLSGRIRNAIRMTSVLLSILLVSALRIIIRRNRANTDLPVFIRSHHSGHQALDIPENLMYVLSHTDTMTLLNLLNHQLED